MGGKKPSGNWQAVFGPCRRETIPAGFEVRRADQTLKGLGALKIDITRIITIMEVVLP